MHRSNIAICNTHTHKHKHLFRNECAWRAGRSNELHTSYSFVVGHTHTHTHIISPSDKCVIVLINNQSNQVLTGCRAEYISSIFIRENTHTNTAPHFDGSSMANLSCDLFSVSHSLLALLTPVPLFSSCKFPRIGVLLAWAKVSKLWFASPVHLFCSLHSLSSSSSSSSIPWSDWVTRRHTHTQPWLALAFSLSRS